MSLYTYVCIFLRSIIIVTSGFVVATIITIVILLIVIIVTSVEGIRVLRPGRASSSSREPSKNLMSSPLSSSHGDVSNVEKWKTPVA